MLEALKNFNFKYQDNFGRGQIDCEDIFVFNNRNSNLILSAPHATQTWAKQSVKKSDLYTGAITEYLAETLDVSSLIRQKFVAQKVKIEDFIVEKALERHFFLDIHGIAQDKPFELAVGTGKFCASAYDKEINLIKFLAEKYKIKMVVNHPDYRGANGLTRKLQDIHDLPLILQLEWRLDMRDFQKFPDNVCKRTIPFMLDLGKQLDVLLPIR